MSSADAPEQFRPLIDIGRRYRANDLLEVAAGGHGKVLLKTAVKSDAGSSWDTTARQRRETSSGLWPWVRAVSAAH